MSQPSGSQYCFWVMVIARTTDHDLKGQPKPFGAADAGGAGCPWSAGAVEEYTGGAGVG